MTEPVRVGIIGCGAISGQYLSMAKRFPRAVDIVACADLDRGAAERRAAEFGVPRILSVDGLLEDPSVELVLNLTVPLAHAPVALRAIEAGKHTYCEKPLGVNRAEGAAVLDAARRRGVRVGCAPDTFLGAALQTARQLVEQGAIGRPVAFTAFMMGPGHESWHPSPEFYYQPGGGPMLDMGPYYLTALLNLLGPIKRLTGAATVAIPRRTITSQPKAGATIDVQTPDHVCGTIEFAGGAAGVIVQSFATHFPDYQASHPITLFGTAGTMRVPDPNRFDGPVLLRAPGDAEWRAAPQPFVQGYGRSIGLADMAVAIRSGTPLRASGDLAFAVLDAMEGFLDSSESGRAYEPQARFEVPSAMPGDLPFGEFG